MQTFVPKVYDYVPKNHGQMDGLGEELKLNDNYIQNLADGWIDLWMMKHLFEKGMQCSTSVEAAQNQIRALFSQPSS